MPATFDAAKNQWARNAAVTSLTDGSGGTANDTLEDVPVAYSEAPLANNYADLAAKVNAILTALRNAGILVS